VTENAGGNYTCVVMDQYSNRNNDTKTVTIIGESDLNSNILTVRHTAQSGTRISQWTKC